MNPEHPSPRPPIRDPAYSIVVPVFNEEGAIEKLTREIDGAFDGQAVEILFVDDASTDATPTRLTAAQAAIPSLRILRHRRRSGQSRAIRTGVMAAQAPIVITLDGDGQNDPADAPRLARTLAEAEPQVGLVGGVRTQRRDSASKRWASRIANSIRRRILADGAVDSGCGLKAFRRDAYLRLPYFDHNHRYLPALMRREGFTVCFMPVNHRQRENGRSNYTNWNRFWAATTDLAGMLWLRSRFRDPHGVDHF